MLFCQSFGNDCFDIVVSYGSSFLDFVLGVVVSYVSYITIKWFGSDQFSLRISATNESVSREVLSGAILFKSRSKGCFTLRALGDMFPKPDKTNISRGDTFRLIIVLNYYWVEPESFASQCMSSAKTNLLRVLVSELHHVRTKLLEDLI